MAEPGATSLPLPGAVLRFWPRIALPLPSADLLARLTADIRWRQERIRLFGREHMQPRLICWMGDPDCSYRYSGTRWEPEPWHPLVADLRARAEGVAKARFNAVLLNLYRDGRDSMGLHADDEPELGERPVIASLSLGAERTMTFRHRHDRTMAPLRLALPDASLLVMSGETQRNWKHGIARTARPVGPRLNLTFRRILLPGA